MNDVSDLEIEVNENASHEPRCGGTAQRLDLDATFRELEAPLIALLRDVTGSIQDAEDALQETFLAALRSIGSFRGDSRLSTWIYRIAIRTGLRIRARCARTALTVLDEEPAAPAKNAAGDSALLDRVGAAIDSLPAKLRVTFALFALRDLAHREIAEILGVPEGTVWSRLHEARKRLAHMLRDEICD